MKFHKIREISDLHNEFDVFTIPPMDGDNETTLVLAGDIDLSKRSALITFLKVASEQFRDVVYIFGNHEYYKTSYVNAIKYVKKELELESIYNVHILQDSSIVIDNVAFIGATLWTSFDDGNPLTLLNAKSTMNDYKHIRSGVTDNPYFRNLTPTEIYASFLKSKDFIFAECKKMKMAGHKVVVITHHAPSFMSVTENFRGSPDNGLYCSNLDNNILDTQPDIWFHGHMHQTISYSIENTNVYTNPRGYHPSQLNPLFNPNFLIEI